MLIKTMITKIHPTGKESYKSTPMYFTSKGLKSGKEKTETRWKVKFDCANGKTYYINLYDGRKVNQFYEGKEIWGNETSGTFNNLESYWISKSEFESDVQKRIQRTKDCIQDDDKEIMRLTSLLN